MQVPTPTAEHINGLSALFEKVLALVLDHLIVILIAAVLVTLAGYVWGRGLGVLNRFLKTVPVSGKYKTEIDRGSGWQEHEEAELRQLASRVWGRTTITTGKPMTYDVKGRINGQMLCLLYRSSAGVGFDSGAIALEVNPQGGELSGYEVGYDKQTREIEPRKYRWTTR